MIMDYLAGNQLAKIAQHKSQVKVVWDDARWHEAQSKPALQQAAMILSENSVDNKDSHTGILFCWFPISSFYLFLTN